MVKQGKMPTFETVDDYIRSQSVEAQDVLNEIRTIIKEVVPDAEELLNYKVPSYTLVPNGKRDHQIMFAAYAKFIGFYPFPTTIEAFKSELKSFKTGKGSIQFPFNKPLPKDLIRKMVQFRLNEIHDSNLNG
ncbi:iron chaperone [Crocinitomix algicola]|uniref:iron chaperone n=1 Tax=Crocinitomix algicola TaxID=1740263 RepID=UPI0009F3F522|nr:DUF1801 domain-containing protein [Crocinitomix algicola]